MLALLFWIAFVLFLIGTVWSVLGLDPHAMPLGCPRCGSAGDADLADQPRPWYAHAGTGRWRCRTCGTVFREHAGGMLVEDRGG